MGRLKHKRGRPSKYRKSLQQNEDWPIVKRKTRIRDGFKCVLCPSKIRLESHHRTYTKNGKSIVGKELQHLDVVVTVCETCHQQIHNDPGHELNPINYPNR